MKVSYTRSYPIGAFLQEKIGFEIEIPDDSEHTIVEVQSLKELCDKAHLQLNPGLYATNTATGEVSTASNPYPQPSSEETRINALIQDINACTAISEKNSLGVEVGLLGYEKLASGNAALKAAYDLKLLQLKAK